MKIAILTSSRADYGIYLPLLNCLNSDNYFELKIIAFGTHLSHFHGYTIQQIEKDGFKVEECLETLILGDSAEAISNGIGNTITKFSSLWGRLKDDIDLVIALGDRYEMFAAVSASVPFNLKIAHIHGGEITLGAIDNKFRHAITLMSCIHFTSTNQYAQRVSSLIGSDENIYNIGALSLENLSKIDLLPILEFKETFNIDLSIPTILTTFHPETISAQKNMEYANILVEALSILSRTYQIVITMPNADTLGNVIRKKLSFLIDDNLRVIGIENFGTIGYFSCIKHSAFLLGNTSSGIIEAASFGKYVINLGDRQKGRARSFNVFDEPISKCAILNRVKKLESIGLNYEGENIYEKNGGVYEAIKILKNTVHV